ncbi:hypothetical protein [uncultured Parabacteroides sp.]|uniref:hypothetical protein n=1 Tax=uncultured Parabacteroides sp. TaxID=512312 RepID=UPI0025F7E4FE|nr:hypothetical protein [uncultured Parabacteroides sp.]
MDIKSLFGDVRVRMGCFGYFLFFFRENVWIFPRKGLLLSQQQREQCADIAPVNTKRSVLATAGEPSRFDVAAWDGFKDAVTKHHVFLFNLRTKGAHFAR